MAQTQQYYDYEGRIKDSERRYERHEIATTTVEEYDFEPDRRDNRIRTFYVDEENGIMVNDIERYEDWLRGVRCE